MHFRKGVRSFLPTLAAGLALASPAFAAMDISSVTAAVGDAVTAVTAIGGAVLGVVVLIAAFRWIKRAI